MFTDPLLLGRYPDLSAFGVGPGGLDCVLDGDLAVISAPLDALGMNYYNPTRLSALPDSPLPFQMQPIPGYPVTAFGWPVIPAGLTELLTMFKDRYGDRLPPIYITENGCSTEDEPSSRRDDRRPAADRVPGRPHPGDARRDDRRGRRARLLRLVADGQLRVVRGLPPAVRPGTRDFETQRRTPKASFAWYRDLIAAQRTPA